MKKLLFASLKQALPVALLLVQFTANAQSLPNVQKESVRTPANIKIDGKATEWDDKFQAYNKATDIYYTLSNDNENLYLTVQAQYYDFVDKIIRGGITFSINHSINKKDDKQVTVTYPVLRDADMSAVSNSLAGKKFPKANGDADTPEKIDELNQLFNAKAKMIAITGVAAFPDNEVSAFNTEGLKAVSKFNLKINYTYELAIPLKYLELPAGMFSYHIKVNEPAPIHPTHPTGPPDRPAPPMMTSSLAPTDFWGEYTLAK